MRSLDKDAESDVRLERNGLHPSMELLTAGIGNQNTDSGAAEALCGLSQATNTRDGHFDQDISVGSRGCEAVGC